MKYIITKDKKIFMFSDSVTHNTVVPQQEARSAGFIKLEEGKLKCYGFSGSLGDLPVMKGDADLISSQLRRMNQKMKNRGETKMHS